MSAPGSQPESPQSWEQTAESLVCDERERTGHEKRAGATPVPPGTSGRLQKTRSHAVCHFPWAAASLPKALRSAHGSCYVSLAPSTTLPPRRESHTLPSRLQPQLLSWSAPLLRTSRRNQKRSENLHGPRPPAHGQLFLCGHVIPCHPATPNGLRARLEATPGPGLCAPLPRTCKATLPSA